MRSKLESLFVLAALAGVGVVVAALAMSFFVAHALWLKWLAYGGLGAIAAGCLGMMAAQLLSDAPRPAKPQPDGTAEPPSEETAPAGATTSAVAVGAAAGAAAATTSAAAATTPGGEPSPSDDMFGAAEDPFGENLGTLDDL